MGCGGPAAPIPSGPQDKQAAALQKSFAIQYGSATGPYFSVYFAPTTDPGSGVPGINGSRVVAPRIASATVMCCTSSVRPIA